MDFNSISSSLNSLPLIYFILAAIINIVTSFISAISYKLILYMQKEDLKIMNSLLILYLSQFIGFFAPLKMGAIFGKPLVTKMVGGIPLVKSMFAVGFENFFSISWQIIMLPILLVLIGEDVLFNNMIYKIAIVVIFAVCIAIIGYKYKWFMPRLLNLKRFLPNKIKNVAIKFGLNEDSINNFTASIPSYFSNKWFMVLIIGLTILQIFFLPFFMALPLSFFNINLSYFTIFTIYWISYILGRLSFLPAGLGVKDVTMGGLLLSNGIDGGTVVKIVILYRVLTFVPSLVVGGLTFLYYGHKYTYKRFFKKEFDGGQ